MQLSEKFDLVLPALHNARCKFVKVKKDKQNSHLKNTYATLDSVLDAILPALNENDLMIMQDMIESDSPQKMKVETTIMHVSGQYVKFFTELPIVKLDPQGAGSSFTYARRYAAAAALGLSQTDDDAQIAAKSVSDWKREIDGCETIDQLQSVWTSAYRSTDPATRVILQEHKDAAKARLDGKSARGFVPASPKKNLASNSAVAEEDKMDVKSQDIADFE